MPVKDGGTDRKLQNRRKSRKIPTDLIIHDVAYNGLNGTPIARRLRSMKPKSDKVKRQPEGTVNRKIVIPASPSNVETNETNGHDIADITSKEIDDYLKIDTNGSMNHSHTDTDEPISEAVEASLTGTPIVNGECHLNTEQPYSRYCLIL